MNAEQTSKPIPVILDTDLGGDIDDTWALAMLLGMPEFSLKLIVTAIHNTPVKTRLIAKILHCTGNTHIPIATGIMTSDDPLTQEDWLGNFDLAQYGGPILEDGVQALVETINESPEPVTLLIIGPATNIAAALRRDPSIAEKARVVAMAGCVYRAHADSRTPIPEYNVVCDIEGFRAVLAAVWDVTLTPLDGCGDLVLRGVRYARIQQSDAPLARVVMENYSAWTHREYWPANESSILFDTVAVYLAMSTEFCEVRDLKLSVDAEGYTVPDENGRTVHCQLGWKNRDAFEERLVRGLTGSGTT